jgi:hypothetical protein
MGANRIVIAYQTPFGFEGLVNVRRCVARVIAGPKPAALEHPSKPGDCQQALRGEPTA